MIHSGLEDLAAAKSIAMKVIREVYTLVLVNGFWVVLCPDIALVVLLTQHIIS